MTTTNLFELRSNSQGTYFVPAEPNWVRTAEELRSAIREGSYQDALDFISNMDKVAIGEPDNYGQTSLHWAALCENAELCSALLEKMDGQDVCRQTNGSLKTALHLAVNKSNRQFIEQVMKSAFAGQLTKIRDEDGHIPLHCAINRKDFTAAQLLIKNEEVAKESVKMVDNAGQTPLHFAAGLGASKICSLLYNPAKTTGVLNAKTKEHLYTILHLAVQAKQSDIVHLFTDEFENGGGLVGEVDRYNQTALHWAAWQNSDEICDILYAKMTPEQICIPMGPKDRKQTALHFATQAKNLKVVELLLSRNDVAKELVGLQDIYGQTALHWASGQGCYEICDILCTKMTVEQICATTGLAKQTALHFAVQRKDEKMVEILVKDPAVKKKLVDIADNNNETALDLAKKFKLDAIEKLLVE